MTNQPNYQPIYIMPENSKRNSGRNAQRLNISAAKIVAETIRTTLGPKGMDKMLVDSLGEVIVTNDGVTILKEMNIEHPSAKMIVEVAKTQEDEVGDGTTTAVVLAGELLKKAEILLDQEVHPTVIAKGYRLATEKCVSILKTLCKPVSKSDRSVLEKIAVTAMTGKGAENNKELLSKVVVDAILMVLEEEDKNKKISISLNDIKLETKSGDSVKDTELISGIVLDKEKLHANMPSCVKDAKIALIDSAFEIKNTETDSKISITDPDKLQAFIDMEENMLKKMVDLVVKAGANVVFCQRGVDDLAQHFLAKEGVFVLRRVKKSDMEKLSKATGANIVSDLKDLSSDDLGSAGVVEEVEVNDDSMTYVRDCLHPKSVTILVRGSTEHVIDEIKRALEDALGDIRAALLDGSVVFGAGSLEIELAKRITNYSDSLSGREQLAVRAFAESLEVIPRTLAENAGLDPIDVLAELRSSHDNGKLTSGINVFSGKIMDAEKEGVIEPLKIKTQAISSASEVAQMILRIDDVIISPSQDGSQENQNLPSDLGM